MEDGMEGFWYNMEWKISGMEWNCMEDFDCYGRFTFHSIVCPAEDRGGRIAGIQGWQAMLLRHRLRPRIA